ncbi:hypothetical protein, partial [Dietzia sp. CW19]|uniref:hypothetical protein n=1 Tax=Dietzia sp. CW19 TaxID=1630634 RepID=UPI0019D643C6
GDEPDDDEVAAPRPESPDSASGTAPDSGGATEGDGHDAAVDGAAVDGAASVEAETAGESPDESPKASD